MKASPAPGSSADRNLLFGILALQMDFITRDQLVAGMNAWVLEKSKPLGRILIEQQALREDLHDALTLMVDKHVAVHGHDTQRSLQALSSIGSARVELRQVADSDVQASLAHLSAETDENESHTRQPTTLGLSSSPGTRFRILRPYAKGGLGQVSVALDVELNREVALKEILDHIADHPAARGRFLLEAEITGGLEHPGIVPVYGLGQYPDGRPFYAMRFIRGDSLKQAIERFHREQGEQDPGRRNLELRQLLGRFVDVCQAVAYAHSRGVLHRDLKPGNIMLCKYGETLIIDWGLAKAIGREGTAALNEEAAVLPASGRETRSTTVAGTAVGTPSYMSPEQASGRLDLIGPASDIYSLGATLYVLLTGQLPFPEKDTGEILQKVQRGDFVPPRRANPLAPPGLDAVCKKAMALQPQDRYATAQELASEIEHWLADEPVLAFDEPWPVRAGRWMRKHKSLVSGAAAALLVAVVATSAGVIWHQTEQARQQADAVVREVEMTRKRGLAEQSIRDALDQADKLRTQLHAQLAKPAGVFVLLNEPARWEAQVQAARAAVEGAQAILANTADLRVDAAIDQRTREVEKLIRQDDADRQLALTLEKIRMDRSAIRTSSTRGDSNAAPLTTNQESTTAAAAASDEGFDNAGATRAYAQAFAEAQFAIHDADPTQTAARIAASPINEQLVAALDDWAGVALRLQQYSLVEPLLALARRADPDPEWRDAVRRLKVLRDPEALAKLAKDAPRGRLSASMVSLIASYLPKGSPERARLLKSGLIRYPGDFWQNLQMASELQTTDLVEAIGFARTAVAVRPHSAAAYNNLANMLGKRHRVDEAIAAYEKALEIEPQSYAIYSNLAGTLRDHRRLKEALAAVDAALRLNPNYARAHDNRGNILGDMNKFAEALKAHQRAFELDPDNAETNNNLGVALRQLGRSDEAIAAYERAIKLNPEHATAYSNLGLVMWEKKRYADAVEVCRKAIKINPNSAFAYNHLGMAFDDLNRTDEALAAFHKSIELRDDFAEAHYNLGLVLQRLKRTDAAVAAFKKAVAIYPHLPQRQGALGSALLQQGSFAEASEATHKALGLKPTGNTQILVQQQWNEIQRCLLWEKRLPQVIADIDGATTKELLELAQFCQKYKERFATALQLYRGVFAKEPALLTNLDKQARFNAACAAVLAGVGAGPLAAKLPDAEKSAMRRQAHVWLKDDLAAYRSAVTTGPCAAILRAQDRLAHWQTDVDLVEVRLAPAIAKLPKDEQSLWNSLWSEVEEIGKAAHGRFREHRLAGTLTKSEPSKIHPVALMSGKHYVFDLHSDAFDTLLKLEDPHGKLLDEHDDLIDGVDLNSRLVFQAPADGMFRLIATSYKQRNSGAYTLRIRELIDGK